MPNTTTAKRTKQQAGRQRAPILHPPLTPEQRCALDVLHQAAQPGYRLDVSPPGSDIVLSARVARAKRYGYGAETAVLFLDALPALDGLTRTEFRMLMRELARAPYTLAAGAEDFWLIFTLLGVTMSQTSSAPQRRRSVSKVLTPVTGTGPAVHPGSRAVCGAAYDG